MLHRHQGTPSIAARPAYDPRQRGYAISFRQGMDNVCPGCGGRHWYVGRASAECARCATALPLAESWRAAPLDAAA